LTVKYIRMSALLALAVLMTLPGSLVTPTVQGASATQPTFVAGRILVKFRPATLVADQLAVHQAHQAQPIETIPGIEVAVVQVPAGAEQARVAAYARHPLVEYAELDYIARALQDPATFTPNDGGLAEQWGLHNTAQPYKGDLHGTADADIDAPEAWALTTGGTDTVIAILDSGIDLDHEDLQTKIVASKDLTGSPHGANDVYGHGTPIAGIAAAATNNNTGVAGVGYNARLLNVKVLDDNAYGPNSRIASGIRWAADWAASGAPQVRTKVINLSLGTDSPSRALEDAVNYAWSKGVVLTCAGGNDGNRSATYPARYERCIAVGATDSSDRKAAFSSYNKDWMDVAAPGLDIYATYPNHPFKTQQSLGRQNHYDYGYGTSTAAPHVAGLAALVWSTPYGTGNQAVRDRIERSADPIGKGVYWIHGRINACRAVGGTCAVKTQ